MNCSEAKKKDIIDFLSKNGFVHDYIQGNDYWFKSPLRSESKASFKVNISKNLWFDFGIGEGGDIIKLICLLFNTDYSGALKILSNYNYTNHNNLIYANNQSVVIENIKELSNIQLLRYLKFRKIDLGIARQYCKEINFSLNNRSFYAVGFKNNSGGFELRNKYFKGCSSPKDVTLFSDKKCNITVFEGFIDFLSFFSTDFFEQIEGDYLILNTLSHINKGMSIMKQYKVIYLFLDNDNAGKRVTNELLNDDSIQCIDMSGQYSGFKDLNEYLFKKF